MTAYPRLPVLPAIMLLCLTCVAQQQQNSPELAVRINNGNERPWEIPAFNGGGGSMANFKRSSSWVPSADESPVTQILFKIDRQADLVIAHLTVSLANEKQVSVGTYRLRENESATTQELIKFGIEPLILTVVRATPRFVDSSPPIQPLVENKTKAIEVVNFYRDVDPARFRLVLQNNSTKGIVAVDLFIPSPDGNGGSGQRSEGSGPYPAIAAGATAEYYISVSRGGRITPNGFVPNQPRQQTLLIRTVVFDDGTYDGLMDIAAVITARRMGRKLQGMKIISLIEEMMRAEQAKSPFDFKNLRERIYALNTDVESASIRKLFALFPSLGEKAKDTMESYVAAGLGEGKRAFLAAIDRFEDNSKRGANVTLVEWLEEMKTHFGKLGP
ncbi:MAG: hypothetical protein ABR594_11785 [Pyrinomonadaceae bacterium]